MLQINSIKKAERRYFDGTADIKGGDSLADAHRKRANVLYRFNLGSKKAIEHYEVMERMANDGAKIPAHKLARAYHRLSKVYLLLDDFLNARKYNKKAFKLASDEYDLLYSVALMGDKPSIDGKELNSLSNTKKWATEKLVQINAREQELKGEIRVD